MKELVLEGGELDESFLFLAAAGVNNKNKNYLKKTRLIFTGQYIIYQTQCVR